ncbi:MAG: RNA polymerase sigma-54 factor, partial [Spirochaetaceae bacterium]|nr:RNA polymerase sigma-54 factor [Spirochaetaceae bacterium]
MQLQRAVYSLDQNLRMNPQVYQSIKLMEMPVMELRGKIEEELDRNPALEMLEDKSMVSLDADSLRKEEYDYFEVSSDSGYVRRGGDEATEEQHKFIEGALSRPETLQEHLLWQLRLQPIDEQSRQIGELLIQNLNSDG